jgi:mitogen-activated protein kinase kinase kinase
VTMIEMLTGSHPWPNQTDPFQILFKIMNLKENEIPMYDLGEYKSENLNDFLRFVFKVNYVERPSADQLLNHQFILLSKTNIIIRVSPNVFFFFKFRVVFE